jgi:thymidine phosphorylase
VEIDRIVADISYYRYSEMEVAAFLIACASYTTTDELLALASAMAHAGTQLSWDRSIAVDK